MVPHIVALMVKKPSPSWITWSSVCAAVCCQAYSCPAWLLKAAPAMEMVVVMWLMENGWRVKPQMGACSTWMSLGLCVRMGPEWWCKSLHLLLLCFFPPCSCSVCDGKLGAAKAASLVSLLCWIVLCSSSLHKGAWLFWNDGLGLKKGTCFVYFPPELWAV